MTPVIRKLITGLFLLLLTPFWLKGQTPVRITGKILNTENGEGIDGVLIQCKESGRSTSSVKGGYFSFKTPLLDNMTLEFRLLGFETIERTLGPQDWKQVKGDTLYLKVNLKPKPILLPGKDIFAQKADTVFGTMKFFVEDFEFYGDKFVLLTFENNLKKAQIKLADEQQKILTTTDIPDEAIELYKDFQGYINVICKEKIYRLLFIDDKIVLGSLNVKQYKSEIMPCTDTTCGRIYFSNYTRNYPAFSWFSYNVKDTSVKKLKYVKDKDLLEMYEEEYDFLKPRDRLNARKLELETGIDKRMIAAEMTDFPHSLYYTPLYAPLFVANDTVLIFDHYKDKLFRFSSKGTPLDSIPISYHHPKNWKEWKHKLLQDRISRDVYAVLQHGGYYVLKKINFNTGKIDSEHTLHFQYASKLRVKNGSVYYIYRPFESGQTKYLYKERL